METWIIEKLSNGRLYHCVSWAILHWQWHYLFDTPCKGSLLNQKGRLILGIDWSTD